MVQRLVRLVRLRPWNSWTLNRGTCFLTERCASCGGIKPGTFNEPETGHKSGCEHVAALAAADRMSAGEP